MIKYKVFLHHNNRLYTSIKNENCFHILKQFYSTRKNNNQNLFDIYKKNPSWLGVYKRHPILKEKIDQSAIREKFLLEKKKEIKLNLSSHIDPLNAKWTPESIRVGALGIKLGVSVLWTKNGFCHMVTLVQLPRDHVLWYDQRNLFPKQYWTGFPVTKNALLFPGTKITSLHFQPGQHVVVQGISIDKGFQGVMRRWGMKGQPQSHGQTLTHRKMGGTGGGQDPGRIFPGKHMAGHVGRDYATVGPLRILRINTKFNVLYIRGGIPGEIGGFLKIKDSPYNKFPKDPVFPTHFDDSLPLDEDLYAEDVFSDMQSSLTFPSNV
ncbi:large ribosomal subunit protein uL3m isoform X2 [Hydra vulgaris]|uniref:large ribosomal subunit protein uL3m isoform X2 n=1 Tax=Hydra vulgaris TaxID=6087 RepID=UPI001F5EBA41|nr:39S ribosomal protein L3, mitochondrial isoform X2 [Hydra vulgaris]